MILLNDNAKLNHISVMCDDNTTPEEVFEDVKKQALVTEYVNTEIGTRIAVYEGNYIVSSVKQDDDVYFNQIYKMATPHDALEIARVMSEVWEERDNQRMDQAETN